MIYTPSQHPKEAFILIVAISLIGIFAGIFVNEFFMIFALVFWMQYTAVLSYLQFRKNAHKRQPRNFTEYLLNPNVRFFVFEFLATVGLLAVVRYRWYYVGAAVLAAWLLFSLNFFLYYRQFRKYE